MYKYVYVPIEFQDFKLERKGFILMYVTATVIPMLIKHMYIILYSFNKACYEVVLLKTIV